MDDPSRVADYVDGCRRVQGRLGASRGQSDVQKSRLIVLCTIILGKKLSNHFCDLRMCVSRNAYSNIVRRLIGQSSRRVAANFRNTGATLVGSHGASGLAGLASNSALAAAEVAGVGLQLPRAHAELPRVPAGRRTHLVTEASCEGGATRIEDFRLRSLITSLWQTATKNV